MLRSRSLSALLLILLATCLTGLACAQPPATTPPPAVQPAAQPVDSHGVPVGSVVQLNVEYGNVEGHSLKLDYAIPPGAGPFPGLLMIHGGGWSGGDKTSSYFAVPTYLQKGIACFTLDYRLSGVAKYPAAVDDCLAAVRWVRSHAAELKVDPDRLAVMGGSAGGHLSLMVATATPLATDLNAQGQPLKSLVVAVASCSGPTDFVAYMQQSADKPPFDAHWFQVGSDLVTGFLGGSLQDKPDLWAAASPITRITAHTPPVYLVYGTADTLVPLTQAEALQAKLQAAGVPVTLEPLPGLQHEAAMHYLQPGLVAFLVSRLIPPPAG